MNVILYGANGKLCRAVGECAKGDIRVVAGVDVNEEERAFPVYGGLLQVKEKADVIIDCSFHGAVRDLLGGAKTMSLPVVIATTGHTEEEKAFITEASRHQPIFMSANMSLGINLLAELAQAAAELLHEAFDIEIVEAHHNKKADAPSGTALMLADAIKSKLPETYGYAYDRTKKRAPREKAEIGIHSVRGGAIFGEHEIIFAGQGEVVRLSHSALSRSVFAEGALAAARFMLGKPAGFYNMKDLIKSAV